MIVPSTRLVLSHRSRISRRLRSAICGATAALAFLALPGLAAPAPSPVSGLRAAVTKTDLTPDQPKYLHGYQPRQSNGVLDHIYQRILVLDDGTTRFVLVSSDLAIISTNLYDQVAERVTKELALPRQNFWWTVTHTHAAPAVGEPGFQLLFLADRFEHQVDTDYTSFVVNSLVKGIRDAIARLEPVQLGVGWGHANANINRRARTVTGETRLGMNPDGAVDRRIGVLRLDRADGSPLAIVANYPIHGTAMSGDNCKISGDAPGVAAAYVERQTKAVVLFVNGAAGNLAPLYSQRPNPGQAHLDEFEQILGVPILEAAQQVSWRPTTVSLHVGELTIETPGQPKLGWNDNFSAYTREGPNGTHLVRIPVRFLRINHDVAIWGAPLELFCEISNEIRERSPFLFTFYYGYLDGWLGYLPTAREFPFGGYETEVTPYTPAAEHDLRAGVLGYLEGELRP